MSLIFSQIGSLKWLASIEKIYTTLISHPKYSLKFFKILNFKLNFYKERGWRSIFELFLGLRHFERA